MNDGAPPLDFGDDELFRVPTHPPATRTDDHDTSAKAAARAAAAQSTIRFKVHLFAKEAGDAGFIDADLKATFPDTPESSYRKRRTELTEDGLIVDSGKRRPNDHGNDEIVWVHREFAAHLAPPQHLTPDQWTALLTGLQRKAPEVSSWATQMLAEGRTGLGRALADLAHQLRLLR